MLWDLVLEHWFKGGSLKDALKAAALGGAVGGLASGVGSVMQGGEFLAGVKSGLPTGFGGGVNPTIPLLLMSAKLLRPRQERLM